MSKRTTIEEYDKETGILVKRTIVEEDEPTHYEPIPPAYPCPPYTVPLDPPFHYPFTWEIGDYPFGPPIYCSGAGPATVENTTISGSDLDEAVQDNPHFISHDGMTHQL